MPYGIKLHIKGEYACFTRPEMKVERVSYDVITPSAARGILEAIYWKPAITWVIDKIHVLKPIKFESIRRNEVASKISSRKVQTAMSNSSTQGLYLVADEGKERQQRAATVLRDVAYLIEAHFEFTDKAGSDDNEGKHLDIFNRRAKKGECFHQPYLGTREFPAEFSLVEANSQEIELTEENINCDLGWMLHDIDFSRDKTPRFFRAEIKNGIVNVPRFSSKEVLA